MRWIVVVFVVGAWSCGDDDGVEAAPEEGEAEAVAEAPAENPGRSRAELLAQADARELTDALRGAVREGPVASRRVATLAVSRLHDPIAIPTLRAALRDPDSEVRANATLGLGALEEDAPPDVEDTILSALAAEQHAHTRAAMLRDLGRVGTERATGAFRQALAGDHVASRQSACIGLGSYGLRSKTVETALMRQVASRAADDPDGDVRFACAYALTRLPSPETGSADAQAVARDLARASEDVQPEVRAMAVRAMGNYPGAPLAAIARRTSDGEWQVAIQAFRTMVKREAGVGAYTRALRARLDAALVDGRTPTGGELHVLLLALDAPQRLTSPLHTIAQQAYDRIGDVPEGQPLSRDRGLLHCAAARLVDRSRRWPSRLNDCGLEQVDEWERKVAMAGVIAEVDEAGPQQLRFLQRMYQDRDARVKIAVLDAATHLDPDAITDLVLEGLAVEHVGVVAAACEAVTKLAPSWRATPTPAAPVLSVRPAGAPLPTQPPQPQLGPAQRRLAAALESARSTLVEANDLEGLQSWIAAASAVGLDMGEPLGELALHFNPALRARAREALGRAGEGEVASVPNAIDATAVPDPDVPLRAHLDTDRGPIVLELLVVEAPTTVARFVELASAEYYDGLTFHRVVPAFVIQGGDPQGTGYGGPGWSQRCEDNRVSYERGTVGMALAGRDTGGSQFFIAHGSQPHLDGRYTAFAQVIRGMELVDAIQVGDRIRSIRIEPAPPS